MGADSAVDVLGPGMAERLGGPLECCTSSHHVVDQQKGSAFGSVVGRKALCLQLEATGSRLTGLSIEAVTSQ